MSRLRLASVAAAALAAVVLAASPAPASAGCGPAGYAYAGMQSLRDGFGISTTLTALATPSVESGHVAGWVGVGAPGEGPGGTDEWLQVGLNSLRDTGHTLYYEIARPGHRDTEYVEVARNVPVGRALRVAVLETAAKRGTWRVWVDGKAVSPPIALPDSHGRLTPMAMAESWDGGRPACNRYAYDFEDVAIATAPGGPWQTVRRATVLQDPGYRLQRRSLASFVAASAARPAA